MAATDYRAFGFSKTLSEENADELKNKFHRSPSRRLKTGAYIGATQLRQMADSLDAGKFDGLQICYGIADRVPGATFGTYELILTEVKLSGPATAPVTVSKGKIYASVPDSPTEPPELGCPPLVCKPKPGQ